MESHPGITRRQHVALLQAALAGARYGPRFFGEGCGKANAHRGAHIPGVVAGPEPKPEA